jgi:beta-xylosidase
MHQKALYRPRIKRQGIEMRGIRWFLLAILLVPGGQVYSAAGKALFEGADPAVLINKDQFIIYPTADGETLSAWSSDNLVDWTKSTPLLKLKDISWIKDGAQHHFLWAPHMHTANGKYYFYFSVGPQDPTPSRIGVAICDTPQGSCVDSGKPILTGGNGFEAIDPMVFTDPKSGKSYLYAGGSNGATLRVYELATNPISIAKPLAIDQPPGFTEAPWMHFRNGIYYLSYSSGKWNDASYSVRYALSLSPTGPWKFAGTILQGDRRYKGPGHHSFFEDSRDGQSYITYGRWEHQTGNGPYNGNRNVALAKVHYTSSGLIEPINMKEP